MYNFVIQLCTILLCIIYIIYNNNKILKKKNNNTYSVLAILHYVSSRNALEM